VTCCVALVGQYGATRSSRQVRRGASPQRGLGLHTWATCPVSTSLFPEVVSENDANPDYKRLKLYTGALLLLRRPPC